MEIRREGGRWMERKGWRWRGKRGGKSLGTWIDGETGTREGMKKGGGGEIWLDNITCVKCRRVCAHRNMFNGFYDCRKVV